jgi:hypothetical protein
MWNNYTVDMLNPDKIASRHAEAAAERRAAEGRVHAGHATGATAGFRRVVVAGTTFATAALHRAGLAVPGRRNPHGPRRAAGQYRA